MQGANETIAHDAQRNFDVVEVEPDVLLPDFLLLDKVETFQFAAMKRDQKVAFSPHVQVVTAGVAAEVDHSLEFFHAIPGEVPVLDDHGVLVGDPLDDSQEIAPLSVIRNNEIEGRRDHRFFPTLDLVTESGKDPARIHPHGQYVVGETRASGVLVQGDDQDRPVGVTHHEGRGDAQSYRVFQQMCPTETWV